ncbi:MAG: LD-carboxypeptidase [Ignavibacteriaceae bacterium]|nr:LD-carboxypeptidase [Ignavibacteriaceae bacterium]
MPKIYSAVLPQNKIKPPRLIPGDTLGLAAPGSYISEDELKDSIANLEMLGFEVTYNERILSKTGYLAGDDKSRAAELHSMFADKKVKGIICARGGYGCQRILPMLDYDLIKMNPKVLIGYSDITALVNAIYLKTGLITFHGPVGISSFNEFSVKYFNEVLINPSANLILESAKGEDQKDDEKIQTIFSGKAVGELVGGNISVINSLIGTEFDFNAEGKIIFLEEIGEEPYRIDRMLTQLIQAGKFEKAAGIALGVFKNCEPKEKDPSFDSSFSLMEVLFDRLSRLNIPIIYGLSFGHIKNKFTLPVGIKAELDTMNQTITLLENAVI